MALADTFKKAKFHIKNLAGGYVLTALQTRLSSVVDSPMQSLLRNTTYTVKDVISVETLPEPGFLICTTTGKTAATEPAAYKTTIEGTTITDGAAKFKVYFYSNMVADMIGSTASVAGKSGFVPAPPAGAQSKVLKGDGTWQAMDIATQAEAEAGTENSKIMTALRVLQAIHKNSNEKAKSIADPGYLNFSNGLILQWGTLTADRSFNIVFPVSFPTILLYANGVKTGAGGSSGESNPAVTDNSLTGFSFNSGKNGNVLYFWIALGY